MFKKKMKQIGAMAMAASMILASVQLPRLQQMQQRIPTWH